MVPWETIFRIMKRGETAVAINRPRWPAKFWGEIKNETEVGFWLLTLVSRRVGEMWVPDHLVWFMPYLFVDNGYAIMAGREVYGFNKMGAQFEKPERYLLKNLG